MNDQLTVQEWRPFFLAVAGAGAALAGLVFVAISLHPVPILGNPLTRARAYIAEFGFLIAVAWSLVMRLPASTAPLGSLLLIALGVGGAVVVVYQQMPVRKVGINIARAVLGDLLVLTPVVAGIVGLLWPDSAFPFLLLAIAASVGLFVLFFQSCTLVLHSVSGADEAHRQVPRSATRPQGAEKR